MPPVPPELQALPLDRAAVDAAIAACLRAARCIGALTEVRAGAGALARQEWRGPARERFDVTSAGLDAEAAELVAQLLGTTGALGAAVAAVELENRRRSAAALAWERAHAEGGA